MHSVLIMELFLLPVVPDVLHIVIIFHDLDELFHQLDMLFAFQLLIVLRNHFDKYGGNLGASGCVSWSFDKKGVLVIDNEDGDYEEDEVMMDAMDAGADDFEAEEDCFTIYTDPDDFNAVADAMTAKKYTFASAQIEMVPQNYQKLESEEHIKLMEKLIDIMEDDDDVQNIWHNWEQE